MAKIFQYALYKTDKLLASDISNRDGLYLTVVSSIYMGGRGGVPIGKQKHSGKTNLWKNLKRRNKQKL